MANNNANEFLTSLAIENHTSKSQAQILLARKLGEKQRTLRKIQNMKNRMRRIARELTTEEMNLAAIEENVRRLTEAINRGVDEN